MKCSNYLLFSLFFTITFIWQSKPASPLKYAELEELTDHLKQLIFDELDLYSLSSMAQTNKNMSLLVADFFRQKFANMTIIYGTISEDVISNDRIYIPNLDWATKLIESFGSLISKFEIYFSKNDPSATQVLQLVNTKCTALKNLLMCEMAMDEMQEITAPFQTVEDLVVDIGAPATNRLNYEMHEMFPNLRNFSLYYSQPDLLDYSMADHYPHLTDLHFPNHNNSEDLAFRMKMIELNPQVQHLYLHETDEHRFLHFISKSLPNLETFQVQVFNPKDEQLEGNVTFKSVKNLEVGKCLNLGKYTFEGLESLEIFTNCSESSADAEELVECDLASILWFNELVTEPILRKEFNRRSHCGSFIKRHSNITKLNAAGNENHRFLLEEIKGFVPNLADASIKLELDGAIKSVVDFLETSPKLETLRLDLSTKTHPNPQVTKLKEKIKGGWNVTETDNGCLIQRTTHSPEQTRVADNKLRFLANNMQVMKRLLDVSPTKIL